MKTKVFFLHVILFIHFLFYSLSAGQENNKDKDFVNTASYELDTYFKNMLNAQNFVGLGACLIKGEKIVWDGYYGYSNLEERTPLTKGAIFHLASLSKTVTATALMQLYEKGFFKLDDDINNYISIKVRNPNFPEKPITFRMLLTHTASLEDVLPNGLKIPKGVEYPHGVSGDPNISLSQLVKELFTPGGKYYSAEYYSACEPGTKYSYSNFAFSLIGYLVEKIAKKDFSEYCKANIFQPLEMNNTGWFLRELDTTRVVFGYNFPTNDSLITYNKVQHFGEPGYPAGNLRTTMQDFSNFIAVFINNGKYKDYQLLKPETVALMLSPQGVKTIPSRSFKVVDIGLTWLINEVEGAQLYSMNGFSGSIFTNAYFSHKEKLGIIYFFTGITMKNMMSTVEITKNLYNSIKTFD